MEGRMKGSGKVVMIGKCIGSGVSESTTEVRMMGVKWEGIMMGFMQRISLILQYMESSYQQLWKAYINSNYGKLISTATIESSYQQQLWKAHINSNYGKLVSTATMK
ncbi:hypothetical protein H6P81_018536 [Aristolochia fimbriata]|uniref:Uncharacterized protein n=1 Tax=Aristolochia fimbriata TaxID=158543 RepID=A0AAV7E4F5_ARIFI|nr:hypothetical protein H6P81_018536 [Aristolochia fimbriata]